MKQDVRTTALYRQIEALFHDFRRPGSGCISDAAEIHVSPDGEVAVFAGAIVGALEGAPPTYVCATELTTGKTRVLTAGPHIDRLPKFSPDGRSIAFLSDRHEPGNFQLYLLTPTNGTVRSTPAVEGWIEYLQWSPDGQRILLGVAGRGADVSGGQGAVTSKQATADRPSWIPSVETGKEDFRWRSSWVYEVATDSTRQVSPPGHNVWEAVWCGNGALAEVASPGAGEGLWYTARLHVTEIATGNTREVYSTRDQLGWPAASPSGNTLAIVEAVCSDRYIVAGELHLIHLPSGRRRRVHTHEVDITYTEWRSDRSLLLAGHRGFETVIGIYDAAKETFKEVWCSRDITSGGRYITLAGIGDSGDCALIGEGFTRAPEIAVIRDGEYQAISSLDVGFQDHTAAIQSVECVSWHADDGLEIQGWLLRPQGVAPYPLVMNVHGGPVWHSRPAWLGRWATMFTLVKCGYAVFYPNPRGSAGRGQEFIRKVYGDMGGADARDLLAGVDHLVARGVADPKRLGVTGGSYGGFMTSWLITQDARFAAAVPVVPHTNQVTQRLLSNIPQFMDLILADRYDNPGGRYFERSPVMHAHAVRTPTLNICGALDRCTPAEEAQQFHNALLENEVESVLVTYPEEGHGVRKFPAVIDYTTRVVSWFQAHMPASRES